MKENALSKSIENFWESPFREINSEKFSKETEFAGKVEHRPKYNSKIITKCHTIIIT